MRKDDKKSTQKGNFKIVKNKLPELKEQGVNCLYIMGAFERDNGAHDDVEKNVKLFKRPDVSPLAVVDRAQPNTMLGGDFAL